MCYEDIELLNIGRHFFDSKIILGKNKEQNLILQKHKGIKVIPIQPGATSLIRIEKHEDSNEFIKKSKELINQHSKHDVKDFEVKKN